MERTQVGREFAGSICLVVLLAKVEKKGIRRPIRKVLGERWVILQRCSGGSK